ncbi:MAG: AraC family transcriptional regulator [Phycisphaerae bacterium]|nr:AraC family transcriptional regulator [Phycisphaerae bacterium]
MKKPFSTPWTDTIHRPAFGVSEDHPISMFDMRWSETNEISYDMHYGLETGIVLEGTMRRYFGEHKFILHPGDAWVCGMWEPHGYDIAAAPCRAVVIIIFPPILAQPHFPGAAPVRWLAPFEAPPEVRPTVPVGKRKRFLQLGETIAALDFDKGKYTSSLLRLKVLEHLLLLMDGWDAPAVSAVPTQTDVSHAHRALRIITSSRKRISLAQAARACGVHRNTLGRQFEDVMGISFSEFGLRYRVAAAAEQLLHSGDSVKKVAADWGFANPSHLHRCFRKHYGCSPSQYIVQYER